LRHPTIRFSSITPLPKGWCSPRFEPTHDLVVRHSRLPALNGLPSAIQLGKLIRICRRRLGLQNGKLRDKIRNAHAAGGRTRLEQLGRFGVDFDVAKLDVHA
jgi:hypothetical protein